MTAREPIVLEQFVYGKLVTHPGGPIVPGSEHRCTGRSTGFPRELDPFCHPSRLGLGDRDARRWGQCGWRDEGGVVSLGVVTPSGAWVLAARLRERSEEGEGVEGRLYAQGLYAALPASVYRWDTLLRAAPALQAVPREQYDMALPPLVVPGTPVDDTLPADWLEQVSLYLRGALSGEPVNVQEWVLKPVAFLHRMSWALAAVPAALRWRLPIGAGMLTMERATAMAYGVAALGGLRVIGGVPRNAAEVDLTRGDRYVQWLSALASGCTTTGELAASVARELPQLDTFDAIDPAVTWIDAARQVADVVGEKRLLVQVRQGGRVEDAAAVRHMRPELLAILAQRVVGGDSATALAEMSAIAGDGWRDAWRAALARAEGGERERLEQVAMLLGLQPIDDPARLLPMASLELGEATDDVAARVQQSSDAATAASPWLPLLRAAADAVAAGRATWAATWRDLATPRMTWRALHDAIAGRDGAGAVLSALPDRAVVVTARALVRGIPVQDADLADLIAQARPDDRAVLDAIIARALTRSVWLGYRIAELAHAHGIPTSLEAGRDERGASVVSDSQREALANEVSAEKPVGPLMLRELLAWQATQGAGQRATRLRRLLALLVGDPYATALLGEGPVRREGPLREVAELHVMHHLALTDEIAERLLVHLKEFMGNAEERASTLLRRWLTTAPERPVSDRRWPLARTVRAFADESSSATITIAPAHHELVKRALLTLRISPVRVAQAARDESALRLAVEYWHDRSGMTLNSDQLYALLEATSSDGPDRSWWTDRIRANGWSGSAGWRWIMRTARDLTEPERKAILRLDGHALTSFVLHALPVPREASRQIRRVELDYLLKQVPRGTAAGVPPGLGLVELLRRLMNFAEQANDRELLGEVGRASIQVARDEGNDKRGLKAKLGSEGGITSWMAARLRDPQTSLELIRRIAKLLDSEPEALVDQYWDETRKR
jgi:hypothetical protein